MRLGQLRAPVGMSERPATTMAFSSSMGISAKSNNCTTASCARSETAQAQ